MRFIKNIFLVIVLFFVNFVIVNFIPHPYNQISIISLIIVAFLLLRSNYFNLNYIIVLIFLIELFSGLPFGVGIISATIVIYIMKWMLNNVLTNRSMYIVFLATSITTILHRILLFVFLYIFNFFLGNETILNSDILINTGYELGMTLIIAFILYMILSKSAKKINPTYVFK